MPDAPTDPRLPEHPWTTGIWLPAASSADGAALLVAVRGVGRRTVYPEVPARVEYAARLVDAAGAPQYVVGGYSSLRTAPGARRFVTDLGHIPAELHDETLAGAAFVIEGLQLRPHLARHHPQQRVSR
ncbi:hypothetical protein AB0I22_21285 [Streptomyces sp. NPDC050610]|uniref:hypothetical protein n=1 Tax=Streptomyces sp. NPDC050610 TaxID=3157097 RepID=UPI00344A51C9